jgi:YD repeat-containing protein
MFATANKTLEKSRIGSGLCESPLSDTTIAMTAANSNRAAIATKLGKRGSYAAVTLRIVLLGKAFLPSFVLIFLCLAQPMTAQSFPDNAQNSSNMTGVPPFVSTSGDSENVNFATGALNLRIPVLSVPQLGGDSLSLALLYNSNAYVLKKQSETYAPSTNPNPEGPPQGYNVTAAFAWQANSSPAGLHWNLPSLSAAEAIVGTVINPVYGPSVEECVTNWTFTGWDGTSHQFMNSRDCDYQFNQYAANYDINVDYSADGSSMRLDTSNPSDIVVTTQDGTAYHFHGYSGTPGSTAWFGNNYSPLEYEFYTANFSTIVDTNGNTITLGPIQGNGDMVLTDTVGRTFTWSPGGLVYTDTNGASRTITSAVGGATKANGSYTGSQFVTNGTYTFQHPGANGTCQMTQESDQTEPPNVTVTDAVPGYASPVTITIPTGDSYNITYVLAFTPIGELTYLQYPGGGYTTFDWDDTSYVVTGAIAEGQAFGDMSCPMEHHEVVAKHQCSLSQGTCSSSQTGTTRYTPGFNTAYGVNEAMTVTDPLGNVTVHTLTFPQNNTKVLPLETLEQVYSGASTLLRTISTTYQSGYASSSGADAAYRLYGLNPYPYFYLPNSVTTTISDISSSTSSVQTTQYATVSFVWPGNTVLGSTQGTAVEYLSNPISQTTTGYDGSTILKTGATTWMSAANGALYDPTQGHVLNRVHSQTTSDSNISSAVTYGYDSRGNVTSSMATGTGEASATTGYARNLDGSVATMTDPLNHVTTYSYGQGVCGAGSVGLPTKIVDPLGHTSYRGYSASSGLLTCSVDPNGLQVSYTYDAIGNLTGTTAALQSTPQSLVASASVSYGSYALPLVKTTTQLASPDPNVVSTRSMDGFGRVVVSTLPNGAQVGTGYNLVGETCAVSNPNFTAQPASGLSCTPSQNPGTDAITYYGYDALGRTVIKTNPDSSFQQWCYDGLATAGQSNCHQLISSVSGEWVDNADENGNDWQRTTDALGHLTSVVEPNGVSATPSAETDYTYDALNNLRMVSQWGGVKGTSGARSRLFVYDGLSRLVAASNPENASATNPASLTCPGMTGSAWTTCYGYDANNNLTSKTDNRNVTISYAYDALNRMLSKSYSDGATPYSCYQYDASSTPNAIGRLSTEWTVPASQVGGCTETAPITLTMRTITAYDAMGRVLGEQQCTPNVSGPGNCTTSSPTPFAESYLYDLAGNTTAYTNGVNNVPVVGSISFGLQYDEAGRLENFLSSWNPANLSGNPLSLFTADPNNGYTASGAVQNVLLGNNIFVNKTYDSRLRTTGETATHP